MLETLEEADLRKAVEEDWIRQEKWRGRSADSREALEAALQRGQELIHAAQSQGSFRESDYGLLLEKWRSLKATVDWEAAPEKRLEKYFEIRWFLRRVALANPLIQGRPVVFIKTRRFLCQMLHEYVGYFYNAADLTGAGVFLLPHPGRSLETKCLTEGKLPRGTYQTLALSYDGRTAYFAFAPIPEGDRKRRLAPDWSVLTAGPMPPEFDFFGPGRTTFKLYALDLDGGTLRQLTDGGEDDTNPCPLPNGDVVFVSSRRGGFCRCNNPWEPIPTYTLHHLDGQSGNVRTISFHETNEWHPSVLCDGRIIYSRWDYVDRSAANFHGLWTTNPDGTNPRSLFGNYTMRISACYQPRAVPGSHKIAFIAGAHHAVVGGSLVLLDPDKVALDPTTGEDRFDCLEVLTPEIAFPEAPDQWSPGHVVGPWPLSEDYYLIGFGYEPVPGMGSGVRREEGPGIYYFDRFGNLELLYRDPGWACLDPIPVAPRTAPASLEETDRDELGDEAELIVYDVRRSLYPLPEDRPIKELRVFQLLPKATHPVNDPRIGHASAENVRAYLGSVPVEADGSAYFRVPAERPLYFQIVDERGHAVQGMRSATYLQRGERRACIGCHEPPGSSVPPGRALAVRRPPSRLESGPDGTNPFSFVRLIQPILDRRCTSCHGEQDAGNTVPPALTSRPAAPFIASYQNLRPYLRWYEWGGSTISEIVTQPGRMGADESPLWRVLADENHQQVIQLSDAERRCLALWMDANVPFYGTYDRRDQGRQLAGESVPLPPLR
ncbi:hypothetical protein JCM17478_01380 [Thermopirellula anaerolimosa]